MKRVFVESFFRAHNPKLWNGTRRTWNGQVWDCLFYLGLSVLAKVLWFIVEMEGVGLVCE
jgi:hypothetical protein